MLWPCFQKNKYRGYYEYWWSTNHIHYYLQVYYYYYAVILFSIEMQCVKCTIHSFMCEICFVMYCTRLHNNFSASQNTHCSSGLVSPGSLSYSTRDWSWSRRPHSSSYVPPQCEFSTAVQGRRASLHTAREWHVQIKLPWARYACVCSPMMRISLGSSDLWASGSRRELSKDAWRPW